MGDAAFIDLIGSYDNLGEPMPNSNTRATLLGVTITFMLLSAICVLFRLYTRFFIVHAPGWDDFALGFVLFGIVFGGAAICKLVDNGLGQHFILLPLDIMQNWLKIFYIANALYITATTLIKMSLILQYRRVFEDRRMRLICIILLVMIALWGTVYSVLAWVPCYPVSVFWDILYPHRDQVCFAYGAQTRNAFTRTYESHAGSNMIFDILILFLAIKLCFDGTTTMSQRIGFIGLLVGGFFVVSISIWRFATLYEHQSATYPTFDPSWYGPISILLSALEVALASICASIPVFWPVLTDSLGGIFVIQEIKITREDRGDEFALNRMRSGSQVRLEQDYESTNTLDSNEAEMRDRKIAADFRMQVGNPFKTVEATRPQAATEISSDNRTKEIWKH